MSVHAQKKKKEGTERKKKKKKEKNKMQASQRVCMQQSRASSRVSARIYRLLLHARSVFARNIFTFLEAIISIASDRAVRSDLARTEIFIYSGFIVLLILTFSSAGTGSDGKTALLTRLPSIF